MTKKMYPWDFARTVRYTLEGATLKKEHAVRNQSDTPMYYEVGGHDAYTLCWKTGSRSRDYAVEFRRVQALHPVITDENVMLSRSMATCRSWTAVCQSAGRHSARTR